MQRLQRPDPQDIIPPVVYRRGIAWRVWCYAREELAGIDIGEKPWMPQLRLSRP
jgi:hypothetical protein